MKKFFLLPAIAIALNAHAAEYFVDPAKGSDSNAGSASAPFQTIAAAIKVASPTGGDTITLKGGTYREKFELGNKIAAMPETPYIIQGAAGERAIVTGFEPIKGWKDAGNGIYTAEVPELINGLFVNLAPQPLARYPREVGKWLPYGEVDEEASTFTALDGLDKIPDIEAIAKDLRSTQMYVFVRKAQTFNTFPITSLDMKENKIGVDVKKWYPVFTGKDDFFAIQNHPLLVKEPGDWACAVKEKGDSEYVVYFKPKSPADLENAFYRTRGTLVMLRGASGIVLRNLEVSGAGDMGINAPNSKDITIESCTVHNSYGSGIMVRNSKNMTVRSNIAVANEGVGITICSTETALVEGNEICFNLVDGFRVIGNASGRESSEGDSTDVTVRRNYIHHHYQLSHPDNIQTFSGVRRLKIEDNVLLFAGQNTMTQDNTDSEMRGNVSMFTAAYIVIFGHRSSHRWLVEDNTFGYGGWGSFLFDKSEANKLFDNIFIATGLSMQPDFKSDHNVFITRRYAQNILRAGTTWYTDLAAASNSSETDANSLAFADLPFKNMPQAHSLYERVDDTENLATTEYIPLRARSGNSPIAKVADFAEGDNVEINGDGVMRKVTAVDGKGIKFTPALPEPPFRHAFILNWNKSTSTQLDLGLDPSSPILKAGRDGKPAGSTLDIAAYQRGELLETGKRTLPAIPEDLKAAWPDPNYFVVPMQGR